MSSHRAADSSFTPAHHSCHVAALQRMSAGRSPVVKFSCQSNPVTSWAVFKGRLWFRGLRAWSLPPRAHKLLRIQKP